MELNVKLLGRNILRRRHAKHLTAEQLGVRAGITGSYVSRLERGGVPNPGYGTLLRIATVLDLDSPDQLLAGDTKQRATNESSAHPIEAWWAFFAKDLERRQSAQSFINTLILRCGKRDRCTVLSKELHDLANLLQESLTDGIDTMARLSPKQQGLPL